MDFVGDGIVGRCNNRKFQNFVSITTHFLLHPHLTYIMIKYETRISALAKFNQFVLNLPFKITSLKLKQMIQMTRKFRRNLVHSEKSVYKTMSVG